ncbi:MAG: hypothetical protein ACLFUU_04165 [Desulfobacteraceae bacterium]
MEKQQIIDTAIWVIRIICLYLKNILVTSWRCLLILFRYAILCWQQQQMRCGFRRLGQRIFNYLEEGKPQPLVQAPIKNQLNHLANLKAQKLSQRQAIRRLREKIRATSYSLPSSS